MIDDEGEGFCVHLECCVRILRITSLGELGYVGDKGGLFLGTVAQAERVKEQWLWRSVLWHVTGDVTTEASNTRLSSDRFSR